MTIPSRTTQPELPDVLVVGGGIIGLSIALELADRRANVRLIERGEPGREASWAGAGILPPGSGYGCHPGLEAMAARSNTLHPLISQRLSAETGIDDGFRRCGAIYMTTPRNRCEVMATLGRWRSLGATIEPAAETVADKRLTGICGIQGDHNSFWVPGEATVRNPRRLPALVDLCRSKGVRIDAGVGVEGVVVEAGRAIGVQTSRGTIIAGAVCLAAGAWIAPLVEPMGLRAEVRPIRGQMVLLQGVVGAPEMIVHNDDMYVVPRFDGRVLVGSTVEDVGFDKSTASAAIAELVERARRLVPALRNAEVHAQWAGLRPATPDGLPILGAVTGVSNAYMAGGHFRAGLHLAPATAELLCDVIEGHTLDPIYDDFATGRFSPTHATAFCCP